MKNSIIIIDKNSNIKQIQVKDFSRDILYKKCGFRKNDNFLLRQTWTINNDICYQIELWARDYGKAGYENKYELPPPIDKTLFFGSIAIVALDKKENIIDLTVNDWQKIYEFLYGGFEDIQNEEEESEDELDLIPEANKTKSGYLKDGFVVEDEASECGSELEEEEYYFSEE